MALGSVVMGICIYYLLRSAFASSKPSQPASNAGLKKSVWDMGFVEMLNYLFGAAEALPPSPDPFDEDKQTDQARQSRRRYAPHVQSVEWDVILNHETVELYLRISQQEARLIREYGLEDIEYENGPAYSAEELQVIRDRQREEETKVADPYKRSILRLAHEEAFEKLKQMKLTVRLGDYLSDYPYTRIFRNRLGATQYADLLKRTILPAVKKELEKRKAQSQTQKEWEAA